MFPGRQTVFNTLRRWKQIAPSRAFGMHPGLNFKLAEGLSCATKGHLHHGSFQRGEGEIQPAEFSSAISHIPTVRFLGPIAERRLLAGQREVSHHPREVH